MTIDRLFKPVDNSPLIIFRIIFGFLITAEAWGAIMTGWVKKTFVDPAFTFTFIDFQWLSFLHGEMMYYYFVVMGLAGVMVMLGWYYRVGIITFGLMWAGVYLAQKTNYNNHYYLLMMLNMVMAIMPANADSSLDAKRNPAMRSTTCSQWCLWFFVAQISIVYFYGGIAKMYPDWVAGLPIAIWFKAKSHYFLVGPLLEKEWFQFFIAYGGIVFDTLIAPALIWKKTRKWAFITTIGFHLFNSAVFQVGIFPYMGIAFGLFYFAPEVINRIFMRKRQLIPAENYQTKPWLVAVLSIWLVIQIALPLRHWLYQGDVLFTEEGHRLSWRMMLRVKYGNVTFKVVDNDTGEEWKVRPQEFVNHDQAGNVATKPDFCWQFVQFLKRHYSEEGKSNISIYASGRVNINGKGYAPLYNPEMDLTQVDWEPFGHADWLLDYPETK